jgi:hypothetical protein
MTKEELIDKIEGLDSDLHEAVTVAYNRGATDWVERNYSKWYKVLELAKLASLKDKYEGR